MACGPWTQEPPLKDTPRARQPLLPKSTEHVLSQGSFPLARSRSPDAWQGPQSTGERSKRGRPETSQRTGTLAGERGSSVSCVVSLHSPVSREVFRARLTFDHRDIIHSPVLVLVVLIHHRTLVPPSIFISGPLQQQGIISEEFEPGSRFRFPKV